MMSIGKTYPTLNLDIHKLIHLKTFRRAAEDMQEWHKLEQPRKEKKK